MSYNTKTEEFERDFPNGAWVSGERAGGGDPFKLGMVTDFDSTDGQHFVVIPAEEDADWDQGWADGDTLKAANGPNESPEHVFVLDWDDDAPNFTVYANPEQLIADAVDTDAEIANDPKLELKLREAVADPGDRLDLGHGFHVTFASVRGAER